MPPMPHDTDLLRGAPQPSLSRMAKGWGSARGIPIPAWASILAGTALLLWPALVNGYPIMFSDTAGLAEMGLAGDMGWDKPWVYGPLMLLLHWGVTFWGVAAAQAAALSAVLWLAVKVTAPEPWGPGPWRHMLLCALLAAGSAAPWFASFMMPDIFAPLTVLCVFLLAYGKPALSRPARLAVGCLAAVAIASHLAHLFVAAGCLAAIAVARPRRLLASAAPLVAALAWLLASNAIGNGVLAVSPYGAVFALARLQADGPGADYLHAVCPAAGYRLCAWADRLPMDSDAFLWEPEGPIWGGNSGPTRVAPEAGRIVAAALRFEPWQATKAALANTARQVGRVQLGDTLGPQYLEPTVGRLLRTYFPPAELRRFEASRQLHGTLSSVAAPLASLRLALLALGAAVALLAVPLAWRRDPAVAGLSLIVLMGVLGNAFATGALSGPHDRYGARVAWLVLPVALAALNAAAGWRVGASRGMQG